MAEFWGYCTWHRNSDYRDNGVPIRTGWIGAGQGLLVTAPADGITVKAENLIGALTGNALAVLRTMDANSDNRFDERDPGFASLRVWKDNGDASSNAGELFTLSARFDESQHDTGRER